MNTPNRMSVLIGGLMPLLLALGLVADARSTYAQTAVAYLPTGPWILNFDTALKDWDGSTLTLTLDSQTRYGLKVAGYINWRRKGVPEGWAEVDGVFIAATRRLTLKTETRDKPLHLSADLSADGRALSAGEAWTTQAGIQDVPTVSWGASIQPINSTVASGVVSTEDTVNEKKTRIARVPETDVSGDDSKKPVSGSTGRGYTEILHQSEIATDKAKAGALRW